MSIGTLRRVFVIPPAVRIINGQDNPYENAISNEVVRDKELYIGTLGNPVYTNLEIQAGKYRDEEGREVTFDSIRLDTVLLTISQSKNIITTQIQGRNGTVKEYIGMGDYNISIQGIITGTNGVYPIDAVSNLKKILVASVPLAVNSWYLQNLDIDSVVVNDFTLNQVAGGYSYQPFVITCLSDKPIELILAS